jgi:hypothetical protein
MSHDDILKDIAGKLPVKPSSQKRMIWMICVAIGVASFAYLLVTQPLRAWGSYAINTIFFLGIAEGAVTLAASIRLTNGHWAGPIQRLGESFASFMPYAFGLMTILLVAGIWTYLPWTRGHLEPRQAPFLNVPFLYIRTLGGMALFWWLASRQLRISLRRDAWLLKPHVADELKPAYEKLTANWRGEEEEKAWARHELSHLAPQIVLTFVIFFSVIGWDFIMALTPTWVSALFGWFVYAAAFLNGMSMTAFLATRLRSAYRLEAYITPNHFWDIGKVVFSFSIFWVYLFWSQYLPIWYANMQEETWWVFLRFEQPWRPLAFTAFTLIFLLPFFGLMNKTTKSSPFWLAVFTVMIMSGIWIERHVLVMPSLNPDVVWLGLPEIGVALGFLGVFGLVVQRWLARYPCVNVSDALAHAGGPSH